MALAAGIVEVDENGDHSGSGLALSLYEAELAAEQELYAALGSNAPGLVASRKYFAARANGYAVAIVASVDGANVRILADALDPGVPSVTRVLAGAVE